MAHARATAIVKAVRKIFSFLREARAELGKVIWPTRNRTLKLTAVVVVATVIAGAFLASVDYGLNKGLQQVLDVTGGGDPSQNQQAPGVPQPVQVPAGGEGKAQIPNPVKAK